MNRILIPMFLTCLACAAGLGQDIFTPTIMGSPSNGGFIVSFDTVTGQDYKLQSTTNLLAGPWNSVGAVAKGTGGTLQITNYMSQTQEFYRVATYSNSVACLSPAGWWKLNGDASDSSGNGINGTLVGSPLPTFVTGTNGYQALSLTGVSGQYVQFPGSAAVTPASITVTAWFKVTTLPSSGSYGCIVQNSRTSSQGNWGMYVENHTTEGPILYVELWDTSNNYQFTDTAFVSLTTNVWYFGAFTYSAAGGIKSYVNGIADGSGNPTGLSLSTTFYNEYMGTEGSESFAWPFDGLIQDVRVYNTELTQAQVQSIFNAGPQ